jgi:hypothetical protein
LHESIFWSAIIFSVVADTIDVIRIIVQWPVGVVFEMIVISGLGQFFRRWYVVGHISSLAVLREHHISFLDTPPL